MLCKFKFNIHSGYSILLVVLVCITAFFLTGCSRDSSVESVDNAVENYASLPDIESGTVTVTEQIIESYDYALPATLEISEIMIKNRTALSDCDGDYSDWIELHNYGSETVFLAGWFLSDKPTSSWEFPDLTIEPGEYMIVFASGKNICSDEVHTDFKLSAGEVLSLKAPDGAEVCSVECTDTPADCSLIMCDGVYSETLFSTPGLSNCTSSYDYLQSCISAPEGLVINEVMVSNFSGTYASTVGDHDWIELRNSSSADINLSDYCISDDIDNLCKYQFKDTVLHPGELYVVICESEECKSSYENTGFSLNSENEQVYLVCNDEIVDRISARGIPYECSYGRESDVNGFFYFSKPTPGVENASGCRRISDTPVASISGGAFNDCEFPLSIELTADGTIYYTLDGTMPDTKSTEYTGPVEISETSVLRAISVEDGMLPSSAMSEAYFINEDHSLPIVSVSANDYDYFRRVYNNENKSIEVQGNISYYDGSGSFSIDCGITLSGATSLSLPKKNLSLKFRGAYGASTLDYDIFGGGITEFSGLTLRSGQDYYKSIIKNELCQNIALQMSDSVISQRSQYCVLYINGNYWGVYALKEKANAQLCASVNGVSRDSIEIYTATVPRGNDFYNDVYLFTTEHNMAKDKNYQQICSVLDIDSLIDWIILEGYFANRDIQSGNLKYYRSTETDGKWRLIFYDLDASMSTYELTFSNILSSDAISKQQVSAIASRLFKNADFRDRFLSRLSECLSGPLSSENVISEICRLEEEISPELDRDFTRWKATSREKWQFYMDIIKDFADEDYKYTCIKQIKVLLRLTDDEVNLYFGSLM